LGFWFPSANLGFQSIITESEPSNTIFFYEALTVCAAILEAIKRIPMGGRLAVFTDNLNTVQLFNSLAALPTMNWMVLQVVDALLSADIDFRVFHVPGIHNIVADHLSRLRNELAIQASPGLQISSFLPPRRTLGA
ncbi:hypothetical protein HYDPIDRAFT_61092, partial [Hydnomerulius pinastri MD-312]